MKSGGAPKRYVIVHGHFYQPPRENPWLDMVERQASAAPHHDWNERIHDQCYRPNAYSRLLDPKGMIVDIHNNYCNLDFNFGPTLFSWLLREHPETALRIVAADRESRRRLQDHGNAIGQVFNHLIMPLANRRDQITQIRWAKDFFRKHFERDLEGLWLAETAINMETVRCLIEEGVRFVVLSPSQAERYRPLSGRQDWTDAPRHGIDTRRPYRIFPYAPNGARLDGCLDVFFFNESLSREASFGDILADANKFGDKIRSCYSERPGEDEAVIIATNGETFGHHKPLSDMCLSYFFCRVAPRLHIEPVNFAWYLATHNPAWEVTLKNAFGEGSAWSCAHGVGRWTRDCGCKTGGESSWNQAWRAPLRSALCNLQNRIDRQFEKSLLPLFSDPWRLRDDYAALAKVGSLEDLCGELQKRGAKVRISGSEALMARRLVEAQKYMLFSFTSCGWFFSDIGGVETVQNLTYAGRALQLALDGADFEEALGDLLAALDQARGNMPGVTGKTVFQTNVTPNLRHHAMIAFTAVMEKILLLDEKPSCLVFDYHGYVVTLSYRQPIGNAGGASGMVYNLQLRRHDFSERVELIIVVQQNSEAAITGLIAPASVADDPLFNIGDLQCWRWHPQVADMDLSSIFEESKALLVKHFLEQLSKDTRQRYTAWMDRNEKIIASLCSLNFSIPDYVVAPIAYLLCDEWNVTVNALEVYGEEDVVFNRLLELKKKAEKYGVKIDFAESSVLLEQLLSAELTLFAASLSRRHRHADALPAQLH